jgi:ankyrin repeat protein
MTAVWVAANNGRIEALKLLAELGADLEKEDEDGWSPACIAAAGGHVKELTFLKQAGCDLNKPERQGYLTPIYCAAENGHFGCLRILIDAGCPVDNRTRMGTPAQAALRNNDRACGDILRKAAQAQQLKAAGGQRW